MLRPAIPAHKNAQRPVPTPNSMSIHYSIEEADLSIAASVIRSLWVKNLVGHDAQSARQKLHHGYLDNPAGRGAVILLKAEGLEEAQGAQGLHPRLFHHGPDPIRAIGLADYVVNAEHRSLGPALMLMRRGVQIGAERFDLVYGLPNAKAAPVCARAGLKRLGTVQRYAKPLASREHLARRLPRWLARCCAPLVDQGMAIHDRVRGLRSPARLICTASHWSDPALDELWSSRPAELLLSERSGRMLRWRFGAEGRGHWQVCLARDRSGQACGYVVWRHERGFVQVGDFLARDPNTLTQPLMLAFARLARRTKGQSISVEFFGSSKIAAQLQQAGMVPRPEQAPLFAGAATPAPFLSPEAWYLTSFDNDAD